MKILHLGLCVDGKNEGLPFALKNAATHYYEVNPGDKDIAYKLQNVPFKPDIVFCQIQSDTIQGDKNAVNYLGGYLKQFVNDGATVINWSGDMRANTPAWYLEMAQYVSVTCFSNMQDVNYFKSKGFKSEFLQIGIDPLVFNSNGERLEVPEIIFMANNYGNQFPLSKYRAQVVAFLQAQYRNRFKVYGNGWQPGEQSFNHSQLEEAKAYRGAKIAISISHFNSDRYFSDRLLRALACGVSVISHDYIGIEKDFVNGLHLTTFTGLENLKVQIEYLLANEDIRRSRATEGANLALSNYSYKSMVENIIKLR
jgi:glycosyltransferase involved in cell wall biosynthesis